MKTVTLANALLWAVAICAAALLGAPTVLSLILMPALATASLLVVRQAERHGAC